MTPVEITVFILYFIIVGLVLALLVFHSNYKDLKRQIKQQDMMVSRLFENQLRVTQAQTETIRKLIRLQTCYTPLKDDINHAHERVSALTKYLNLTYVPATSVKTSATYKKNGPRKRS